MVRSPFAHANIISIDTTEAKASRNVVTVLTGAELGESQGVLINAWAINTDQIAPTHVPMPADRVAFAGEIVAVVVALVAALFIAAAGGSIGARAAAAVPKPAEADGCGHSCISCSLKDACQPS